jgi:hypothetical protein
VIDRIEVTLESIEAAIARSFAELRGAGITSLCVGDDWYWTVLSPDDLKCQPELGVGSLKDDAERVLEVADAEESDLSTPQALTSVASLRRVLALTNMIAASQRVFDVARTE